jgi:hypothetical protein
MAERNTSSNTTNVASSATTKPVVKIVIYENQKYQNKKWISHPRIPWSLKDLTPCKPVDEYILPDDNWIWLSNWRIEKNIEITDKLGWEYASKLRRFKDGKRGVKVSQGWNDYARRRAYQRVMLQNDYKIESSLDVVESVKRDTIFLTVEEIKEKIRQIQRGLKSINSARRKIEAILLRSPNAVDNEHMVTIVETVRNNSKNVLAELQVLERVESLNALEILSLDKLNAALSNEQVYINSMIYVIY